MKQLALSFLAVLALGISNQALAGVFIEPFIGYEMGDYENGATNDTSGTALGARLGYSILGLGFGAEYARSSQSFDLTPDQDWTLTDLGVFASFDFPILLRVFATVFLDSSAEGPGNSEFKKGSGTRIGVGWTGFPFIVVNLEKVSRSYDENQAGASVNAKVDTTMISVSLPLP